MNNRTKTYNVDKDGIVFTKPQQYKILKAKTIKELENKLNNVYEAGYKFKSLSVNDKVKFAVVEFSDEL